MDRQITLRYYRIDADNGVPNLAESLKHIFQQKQNAADREENFDNVTIRLERFSRDDSGTIHGEVVRKQTENIPPEARDLGLEPLSIQDGAGLGHCVAFCYEPKYNVLCIQSDNRAVSIGKFLRYVHLRSGNDYTRAPVLSKDAWDKLFRGEDSIRSLEVCVASLTSLNQVEPDIDGKTGSLDLIRDVSRMSHAASAPVVTVTLGMGRNKGTLKFSSILENIKKLILFRDRDKLDVRKIETKVLVDGSTIPIDLLKELLSDTGTLELVDDPEKNYTLRKNWIHNRMQNHDDYLRS